MIPNINKTSTTRCRGSEYALIISTIFLLFSCQKSSFPVKTDFVNKNLSTSKPIPKGINVNDLGIIGDGKTDNTDKIQSALVKDSSLYFPDGDYVVSKTIELNSGNYLRGNQNSRFVIAPSVSGGGNSFYFFEANSKSNITIRNLNFLGHNLDQSAALYAVNVLSSSNISLNHINCSQAGILKTGVAGMDDSQYDAINFATQASQNITVDSSYGAGSDHLQLMITDGLQFVYANHWKVSHTILKYYRNGVEWWGGDSNPSQKGAVGNERKCANGSINYVHVENVGLQATGAGIWGSMGSNIQVTNSSVNNVGDVGIDFEGCLNSFASQDSAINCTNGALATFFLCNGITFDQNMVASDDPTKVLLLISNSSQDPSNQNITFSNNHFVTKSGIGILQEQGAASNLNFIHNTLQNSVLSFISNNNEKITINQNQFNFSTLLHPGTDVIEAGHTRVGNELIIDSNQVASSVLQPVNSFAMHTYQDQFNNNVINTLGYNLVTGFPSYCLITWDGLNSGINCETDVKFDPHNPIPENGLQRDGNGNQNNSIIYLNGKKI